MNRALILLCLVLFINETPGMCATTVFPPLQPINGANEIQDYSNSITSLPDQFVKPTNADYPNITQIENSLFGKAYTHQNISTRLSRIEKSLFTTTYPSATTAQRIDNIISNFNQINKYPNISKNELSRIESKILKQTFPQNSAQRRIERLEQQVLGAVQTGDLNSRLETLKIAAKNSDKADQFPPNTFTNSGWKGNLANGLLGGSGAMTGFTPPINPYYGNYNNYSGYNNNYGVNSLNPYSSGYGMYRGSGVNRGLGGYSYNENFSNCGSGTGVTILD